MKKPRPSFRSFVLLAALGLAILALGTALRLARTAGTPEVAGLQVPAPGACGISQAAFCDTFDQPAGNGNRSGQLAGAVWGVSRTIGYSNLGQGQYDAATQTQIQSCGGVTTVRPPNDVIICNGQLREATNDAGNVTALAMYPKQPFDFAGRTGVVAFDVSNDAPGIHTVWPEVWITDQPVPAPFTHFNSWIAVPRNGFGIRFAAGCTGCPLAPACPVDGKSRWTADSAVVVRNYVTEGSLGPGENPAAGAVAVTPLDCVTASNGMAGSLNHVELHVSQSKIDIYATDAGTTAPLHHIAVIQNANLSLTRGLIWLEDVHYNAAKDGGQAQHTFAWDNVGFDGPVLAGDLAFDALDALLPVANYPGEINLGWLSSPGSGPQLSIPGVTNISNASAALLTFTYMAASQPSTLTFALNAHPHTVVPPKPPGLNTNGGMSPQTIALTLPLSDVVAGTNTLTLSTDLYGVIANVDLVMVGAAATAGPTAIPVPTQATISTSAPAPISDVGCTAQLTLNGTPTTYTRQMAQCANQ